jgi:hypothetical protein
MTPIHPLSQSLSVSGTLYLYVYLTLSVAHTAAQSLYLNETLSESIWESPKKRKTREVGWIRRPG